MTGIPARQVLDDTARALDRIREREVMSSGIPARSVHTTFDIQSSLFAHTMGEIRDAFEREIGTRGEPDLTISRLGKPYLERWFLERAEERCVYLHRFVGPDPDVGPHDHPCDSASLIVAGSQDEYFLASHANRTTRHRRIVAGDILYRSARFSHQLRTARTAKELPLSLFVFGPRLRDWGFWVERDGELHHERHPAELNEETT